MLAYAVSALRLNYQYHCSFKTMTSLSFDVLAYAIVRRLSVDRDFLTEDTGDLSKWIQSIGKFVGKLYRKYPTIELGGLLQFIVNRIKVR